MAEHAGFDPRWLQPDASLNRTRLAPLPGANPAWIGHAAFDLLSRAALLQLRDELSEAAAVNVFGCRLGHLIATLHRGAGVDSIQGDWRRAFRAHWTRVKEVWLGGGLAASLGPKLLDATRSEAARLGATVPSIELAAFPSALPLIGAARMTSARTQHAVVLDFGHTTVKRGVATYSGKALTELRLLDLRDAPARADISAAVAETIADTMRWAVAEDGIGVGDVIVVSLASYLDRRGNPADTHSLYAALQPMQLQHAVRQRTGRRSVRVRLTHDGTAAAYGVIPATTPAAVIVLGTALGVGFAPPPDYLRPLAANFTLTNTD